MTSRFYFFILFFLIFLIDYYTKHFYYNPIDTKYDSYLLTYVSEDFTNYKVLKYQEYMNKELKQFSIKIDLDKNKFKNETYYLNIISDVDSLAFTNTSYIRNKNMLLIKLDKDSEKNLFFNYKYKNEKKPEFRFNIINSFEYEYLLPFEGILYGIAYGIIFSAFVYYLIIYFTTFKRYFLYYSLMQLCVLLVLLGFIYYSFKPYPDIFGSSLVDFFETMVYIFTLLFTKEVLNTKKYMPVMNDFLGLLIFLNILDIFAIFIFKSSILYNYLPFYMIFLIITCAGIQSIYIGNKSSKTYTIGWAFMTVFVFFTERGLFSISGIYSIHIVAPIESLIFSLALALSLRKIINEKNEKEKLLIHKSKMASMGEMINNIAHQWRQPLMNISYINMNIQLLAQSNKIDEKYLNKTLIDSNEQLEFMSKTIDDFSKFYDSTKEKEYFLISNAVQKAISIMNPILKDNDISLNLKIISDTKIYAYENEYSQVVLNLISNAKDALLHKGIKDGNILIVIHHNNYTHTTISDNAGGIPPKIIDKIFEPYFTTKDSGSGIGLYMSKMIIESHFKGSLEVKNLKEGACFDIKI